jgi:endoglucanase
MSPLARALSASHSFLLAACLPLVLALQPACGSDSGGGGDDSGDDGATPPGDGSGGGGGGGDDGSDDGSGDDGGGGSIGGPLRAVGGQILDEAGDPVRITGINWFGLETQELAPHGLNVRSMDSILDQVVELGFNALRVPFASQIFDPGATAGGIDFNLNPDLMGLAPPEILDTLIAKAGDRGLRVILDRHRPDSTGQSELWYTQAYSEERWITDWAALAERYADNPTVIACDLHNEPHGAATWGDGNEASDWRAAAARAGDAILAAAPNMLIVVEGIESFDNQYYWWGGNLRGAAEAPVELAVPGRLVYSAHDYPASLFAQPWFSDPTYPANLPTVWGDTWGYLAESGTAPVLVGEFGTKYETESDQQWLEAMAQYIGDNGLSFTFWSLNPDSGDTGGILEDDWQTVREDKMAILTPILAPLLP